MGEEGIRVCLGFDFFQDGPGCGYGIVRSCDGAAHDQIVCAVGNGQGRRHDARLIVGSGSCRTDAGTEDLQGCCGLDAGCLVPGTDHAVQAPGIGKACQLNVVLSESGEYSNVDSVMPIPKGFTAPESHTKPIMWDMDNWNDEVLKTLPEWVQEKIKKSTQYQKEHAPTDSIAIKAPIVPAVSAESKALEQPPATGGAPF